jgi:type I restriction enzyme S subunit
MLHRAFTGELTAKWREAHLKELLSEMELQKRLLGQSENHFES